jgi:hypothetical protein
LVEAALAGPLGVPTAFGVRVGFFAAPDAGRLVGRVVDLCCLTAIGRVYQEAVEDRDTLDERFGTILST